jgi:hypothetical protein
MELSKAVKLLADHEKSLVRAFDKFYGYDKFHAVEIPETRGEPARKDSNGL